MIVIKQAIQKSPTGKADGRNDFTFKAVVLQMLKNEKVLKLTVNTGQVMFNGEIFYYDPLIQLKNRW